MSPAIARSAAVAVVVQSALEDDGQLNTDRRATFAQRRGAAGQPANINPVASTSTAAGAGGTPASPRGGVRRRSLFADADAWHTPEVQSPPSAPVSPAATDPSMHLKQARASVALAQIGAPGPSDGRTSSVGLSGGAAPNRSSRSGSTARAVGSILVAPFRAARTSISAAPSLDPLLAIQLSDLRRPSFQVTNATTLPSGRKSPKPAFPPRSSSAASGRRLSVFPAAGRRGRRAFRAYILLFLAVLALLKITGRLPSTAQLPSIFSPTERTSSASADAPIQHREDAPVPQREETLRVDPSPRPKQPPSLHKLDEPDPMFVHDAPAAPAAEAAMPAGTDDALDVGTHPAAPPAPASSDDKLVLSPVDLAAMRAKRAEKLWAAPEGNVRVESEDAKKGHLHESTGLGQVKNDAFMPAFLHKRFPNTRWVVPLADKRPVGVSDEAETAWYNIDEFPYVYARDQDAEGMYATARRINAVIADERTRLIRNLRRRGGGAAHGEAGEEAEEEGLEKFGTKEEREWASRRIVLAGFSQGAVMTLVVGLTHPERLGALVVFSGYLPLRDELAKYVYDLDRQDLPIFWGHGTEDKVLTFPDSAESLALLAPSSVSDKLRTNGAISPSALVHTHPSYRLNFTNVEFHWYDNVAHTFCFPELLDVDKWLRSQLPEGSQRGERLPRIGEGMELKRRR